jgi:hypothetical protein
MKQGEPLEFLVAIHEEGTGITWQQNVTVDAETEQYFLFERENIGLAFLDARNRAIQEVGEVGDLTGYSAVLFGDAASKHRRDLAMAD